MRNGKNQASFDGASVYLLALLSGLVVQLLASIVILAVGKVNPKSETILNLSFMALIQGAFFLSFSWYKKKSKVDFTFKVKKLSVISVTLCVVCSLVVMLCFVLPAQWFAFGLEKIGYKFSTSLNFSSPATIILGFIVTVFLAPVVEEMIFRGALLGSIVRKRGVLCSVVVCGLAFSLMHMNPEQTVYQFFLGSACSYLVICTGNILCSIIVHSVSNLLAFLLMLVPAQEGASYALPYPVVTAILTVVLAVVGVIIITLLGKKLIGKREKKETFSARLNALMVSYREGEERIGIFGKKGYAIALLLGISISVVMWLVTFVGSVLL